MFLELVAAATTYTAAPMMNVQACVKSRVGRFSMLNGPFAIILVFLTLNLWRRGCLKWLPQSLRHENKRECYDIHEL